MNKKRLLYFVVFVIFISVSALAACGDKTENNTDDIQKDTNDETDIDSPASESEDDSDSRANYKDSLPDGLDFGGMEYRILTRSDNDNIFLNAEFAEEEIGDIVHDAVYKRQKLIEEKLNVTVKTSVTADTVSSTKKSVNADDDIYDVVAGYSYFITPLALDGFFVNLSEFPYIDYEKPWWPDSITGHLNINGKLYFATGDFTLSLIRAMHCIVFNKQVAQDFAVPNLYQTVRDGDWTLDKLEETVKSVSRDVNGDGIWGIEDIYGLATLSYDEYFPAFQLPMTETNGDGTLSIAVYNEKFVNAYNRMYEIAHSTASYSIKSLLADRSQEQTLFREDRLLFNFVLLTDCEKYRDMESDFGILPHPKYDKTQDNYYTVSHDYYSLLCVPITADQSRYQMIGAFTEAVAAEGYRTVTPAYFDVALKNKYSRDDESFQILDMLAGQITFQPAIIYSGSLGNIGHLMRQIIYDVADITSFYEKNLGTYEKAFNKFNEKFAGLD
ncbi:MAG: hypothetical protein FWD23_00760 [Oscillospiraceae bacterium]|nr:hypothetical protein [Oscillospiraceae bacterium]